MASGRTLREIVLALTFVAAGNADTLHGGDREALARVIGVRVWLEDDRPANGLI